MTLEALYKHCMSERLASNPSAHPSSSQSKKSRSAAPKSSINLFQRCQHVFAGIDPAQPKLSKSQVNALKTLLDTEKAEWSKGNKQENLVARSESAMYLARHFSSLCRLNSHKLVETASKYHDIACENLGIGKYDVRGDAFWNKGEFFEKPPTIEYLSLSAKCYKTAAKATFFWSYESHDLSVYTKAAEIYKILEAKHREEGNLSLAKECARQASKCSRNAKKNMREKGELQALRRMPVRKKAFHSNRANTLYSHGNKLYASLQIANLPLEDDQVQKITDILAHDRHVWLHHDATKAKKHLRLRTELAYLLAKHYSNNEEIAVKYYQIALEKFSIGKYDVNGKAHRSYADFLKTRVFDNDQLSLSDIECLQQAIKNYKIAAKATYHHSSETELDSSFSDAAMIYQRLANEGSLAVMREYYSEKAVKCAKNALKIVGEIDIEIIHRFERGLLSPSQQNAVNVLKNCLGLDSEASATQSLASSSTAPVEPTRTSSNSTSSSETREKRFRESDSIDSEIDSETDIESNSESDFESDSETDIEDAKGIYGY